MKAIDMVKAFQATLAGKAGFPVDLEGAKNKRTEPHISLSFSGFEKQGTDREKINFTMALSASGEGPSYFLDKIIELSRAIYKLKQGSCEGQVQAKPYLDVDIAAGFKPRAIFTQIMTGRFQENQEEKFKYEYMEMYRVELSFNPIKLEEI